MNNWALADGRASITFDCGIFEFNVARPELGLRLVTDHGTEPVLQFAAADNEPLPKPGDTYVRQGALLAEYPQHESQRFGFHLESRRLEIAGCSILEFVIAVQTTLLDCHPMIDVQIPGKTLRRRRPTFQLNATLPPPSMSHLGEQDRLAAPITEFRAKHGWRVTVMLPPCDWPVTGYHEERSGVPATFRLFEEFLEKGVIRKAKLWLKISQNEPSSQDFGPLYAELCGQPLPLTT